MNHKFPPRKPVETKKEFAVRLGLDLKDRRESLGLTLPEVKEKTGLPRCFLEAIEMGEQLPTTFDLSKLLKAYGLEEVWVPLEEEVVKP